MCPQVHFISHITEEILKKIWNWEFKTNSAWPNLILVHIALIQSLLQAKLNFHQNQPILP